MNDTITIEELKAKDAEIDRLRKLVESAFREGYRVGWRDNVAEIHSPDYCWEWSDAREAIDEYKPEHRQL